MRRTVGWELCRRLASASVIQPQKRLQLLIRLTKDDIEGKQFSVHQIAFSLQDVDA